MTLEPPRCQATYSWSLNPGSRPKGASFAAALAKQSCHPGKGPRGDRQDRADSGFDGRDCVRIRRSRPAGLGRPDDGRADDVHGTLNGNKDGIATAVSPPFTYTQEWLDFDLLGNWLQSKTRVATTPTATLTTDDRTVNSVNEYLTQQINGGSTTNFANDDNGNLTDDGTQEYVYDAENRLIEVLKKASPDVTIQTYAYDALGRRVKTVDNCPSSCTGGCCSAGVPACISASSSAEIWHIYASTPACIEEYEVDSPNVLLRYFMHGTEFPDPLAMVDNTALGSSGAGTAEYFWYLKDALGSIVALKNSSDAVVERYVYDPYGKTTVTNAGGTPLTAPTDCLAAAIPSAYANPFCWTGQRYDARAGLYHFLFRSYSPVLGRWLQRDPSWPNDSLNMLEYAGSGPATWIDPDGLSYFPSIPPTDPAGLRRWLDHYEDMLRAEKDPAKRAQLKQTIKKLRELLDLWKKSFPNPPNPRPGGPAGPAPGTGAPGAGPRGPAPGAAGPAAGGAAGGAAAGGKWDQFVNWMKSVIRGGGRGGIRLPVPFIITPLCPNCGRCSGGGPCGCGGAPLRGGGGSSA